MEQTTQNLPATVTTCQPAPEYQAPAPATYQYQPAPSYFSDLALFESGQRMAKLLAASKLVPQQFQGNVPDTLIALEMAARTGSSPLAVMQSMYIVHGKPSWSATFIIASINASGRYSPLRFDMTGEGDDLTCRAYAVERETGERLESPPISIRTAKAEGWYSKNGSKWQTMPELMLRYRAATLFGRLYAADILMGMQTADELYDNGRAMAPADPPAAPVIEGNGGPATVAEVNEMLKGQAAGSGTPQAAEGGRPLKEGATCRGERGGQKEDVPTGTPAPEAAPAAPEPAPVQDREPAPPADEEPPHPAETADARSDAGQAGEQPPEEYRAMLRYIKELDDKQGMSELRGWANRHRDKLLKDLGGLDSEWFAAVIEHWQELVEKLPSEHGNGKKPPKTNGDYCGN